MAAQHEEPEEGQGPAPRPHALGRDAGACVVRGWLALAWCGSVGGSRCWCVRGLGWWGVQFYENGKHKPPNCIRCAFILPFNTHISHMIHHQTYQPTNKSTNKQTTDAFEPPHLTYTTPRPITGDRRDRGGRRLCHVRGGLLLHGLLHRREVRIYQRMVVCLCVCLCVWRFGQASVPCYA